MIRPVFSTYKTITLGKCPKNFQELKKEIEVRNTECSSCIEEMVRSPEFTISATEKKVELVLATGKDLLCAGNWVQKKDVISQALKCGLELCPPEVGPALFLQHRLYEYMTIAMTPIKGSCFVLSTYCENLSPSTDGMSRDEKPIFQEEKYGPRIPFLMADNHKGASATHPFVFVRQGEADEEVCIRCNEGCLWVKKGQASFDADDCDGAGHSRSSYSDPQPISKERALEMLTEVSISDPRYREEVAKAREFLR